MSGRQAKVISTSMLRRLLAPVAQSSTPERDRVMVLLSTRAGLRAGEIAGLEWSMVLDPRGHLSSSLNIENRIAKKRSGCRVPLHPDLGEALVALRGVDPSPDGPVTRSARGGSLRPNSIVNWFTATFAVFGYKGCSSHSGRRTFITTAARTVHKVGGSLRDVQLPAGHKSLSMTQSYIDGTPKFNGGS